MFTFYDNYIEIDEDYESSSISRKLSTPELRKMDPNTSLKHNGVPIIGHFIKSIKIKNMSNNCYEIFKIIDEDGKFILNSDEIPYFFDIKRIEFLYIDIKEDDNNNYIIESNIVDGAIIENRDKFFDDINNFYKNNILTYVLKDRVLLIKKGHPSHRSTNKITTIYDKDNMRDTYVPKIKSNSKSAKKR